jgi:hypothetical protein
LTVLDYSVFISETILFVLAGTLLWLKVYDDHHIIGWQDYVKSVVLYISLHVIRMGLLVILQKPLNYLGYGLNLNQAIVVGFAGIRGSISLALALIIDLDQTIPHEIQEIVLFHTANICMLTLIINGSTMGFLIRYLGMLKVTKSKEKPLRKAIALYRKELNRKITDLKEDNTVLNQAVFKSNFSSEVVDGKRLSLVELRELAGSKKICYKIFQEKELVFHNFNGKISLIFGLIVVCLDP